MGKFALIFLTMLLQEGLGALGWWSPLASRQGSKVVWAQLFLLTPPSPIMLSHKASLTMSMGKFSLSLSPPVKVPKDQLWRGAYHMHDMCASWHAALVNGEWHGSFLACTPKAPTPPLSHTHSGRLALAVHADPVAHERAVLLSPLDCKHALLSLWRKLLDA